MTRYTVVWVQGDWQIQMYRRPCPRSGGQWERDSEGW